MKVSTHDLSSGKKKKTTGQKLQDTEFGNNFLDMSPKAQATKENIDKLDFMKIKSNAEDTGSIPRLGTKLPHVTEQLSMCHDNWNPCTDY